MKLSYIVRMENLLRNAFIAVGLVLCVVLLLFVKTPEPETQGRTVVQLWNCVGSQDLDPPGPAWFNEEQDQIYVQRIGVPILDIERKFLTTAVGNVSPDLFEFFGSVAQWSSRGALMPLNECMERDGFDQSLVFPAMWNEMSWNGKIYAIPTGAGCEAFYWNKEHFRQAGLDPDRPPRTWKELGEYAEKLTLRGVNGEIERAGYIPGYWDPFGTPLFAHWPLQKGAQYLSSDGKKVNLTSQACVEALEWEAGLFEKLGRDDLIKLRSSFGYGSQHGFSSGQVSMVAQKSSFIQELAKFAPDLEYGVSLFPIPEGGHPASLFGALWIGIPAGAKHPEEAWEYIKYYTQNSVQQKIAEFIIENSMVGFFPANIEVARSPIQMSSPGMDVFLESMDWAYSPTVVPLAHAVFWREYLTAWDQATRGLKSPKEALTRAEQSIQRALDDQLDYDEFYRQYQIQKERESEGG